MDKVAEAEKVNLTGIFPWENVDNQLLCTFSCFATLSEECEESDDSGKKSINLGKCCTRQRSELKAEPQSPAFARFLQLFTPL